MKKWFVILLMVSLCTTAIKARAEVGCESDATGYLYYDAAGGSIWGANIYEKTPRYTSWSSFYCVSRNGKSCYIRTKDKNECSGCPKSGSWYYQSGKEYNFYYVQCPIDDYAGLLVLAVTGAGFLVIRKTFIS